MYETDTNRRVLPERVMAWHVRTVLGDALWRTEAGVDLPDGGNLIQWIDEIQDRLAQLHLDVR